jgi:hypothetical protein
MLLFAFGLAFACVDGQTRKRSLRIPTVPFCELASHPERYINKLVRTKANNIVWRESSYLYADRCLDAEHRVHDNWDCADDDYACQRRFFAQLGKLARHARSKPSSIPTVRVKAVFLGRLVGPGSYGHPESFRYEFRITRVERVADISRRVSWKGL